MISEYQWALGIRVCVYMLPLDVHAQKRGPPADTATSQP